MYIHRELESNICNLFKGRGKNGLILSGIVGCGKTTLVEYCLKELKNEYQTFSYTGDDLVFRNRIKSDTTFIAKSIRSVTQKKSLVFIDEVQKCVEVFDAIKYAYDSQNISFIISGSNPDFLNTNAKKRLQRRAEHYQLFPFSLPEILSTARSSFIAHVQYFYDLMVSGNISHINKFELSLTRQIQKKIEQYFIYGGIPLVHMLKNNNEKLSEIRKVVERGFDGLSKGNLDLSDIVMIELAKVHSREFTYQNIFQKTGIKRRDVINNSIDQLINHGYLFRKKPFLFDIPKRSYLNIFSYCDPGIVTYMTGDVGLENMIGPKVEGMVHTRLVFNLNLIPLKTKLSYYRPFSIDRSEKLKFLPGEIDFIFQMGKRIIPIEVKHASSMVNIKIPLLEKFMKENKSQFGIVLYGGVPYHDKDKSLIYWPYWLV